MWGSFRAPAPCPLLSWVVVGPGAQWAFSKPSLVPSPGARGPPTLIGGSSCLGWSRGRVSKQGGPMGPWVCGRKELTSKGVTLLLYQNRALDQTLVKMPVPWAGLAPCPLPPQQTPEPAYPTSPAFPPLSCPFASRVVYQDGFYGAEIYVSAAPGGGRVDESDVSCVSMNSQCPPLPAPLPPSLPSWEPRRAASAKPGLSRSGWQ